MKRGLFLSLLLLLNIGLAYSQVRIPLYSGKAPGSESWDWKEAESSSNGFNTRLVYNVVEPSITAYFPEKSKANGTSVIIAPGGAFHILSIDSEGIDVAKWLNQRGITAFVLKYRVVHILSNDPVKELSTKMQDFNKLDKINAPVIKLATQDGLKAMEYVRNHASDWGLNPQKIGFMGFSAGGTLTMSVLQTASDANRPNFVAPIYLYKKAVLGTQIPSNWIPIFIAAASDDNLGLATHSVDLYLEWLKAKQPAELHMYVKGGHGFGMRKMNTPSDYWTMDFEHWLHFHQYIP
ncbi:alpha/beta hydrolase [Aquirufa aurantiipilula]|uniref:alpha/beta hydrolase n=1 Tax=Aquirufa aurantiipilula TaxID=2696561 RepID=UPI001CAA55E7|nr:alpha/beta hydrolase [Aquirufa aurantiipilula]MBZ1326664.1 alpha/beta hydrolase [Aquirufa aurantiipilula]